MCNLHNCDKNFQEEIPLKLTTLLVMTLFVLCCSFASAQSFGFLSTEGGEYCDYEYIYDWDGGIWAGDHILTVGCGYPYNGTQVGATTSLTSATNPLGFAIKGVAMADNIFDAIYEEFTGYNALYITQVPEKKQVCDSDDPHPDKYGWEAWFGVSSEIFAYNYGCLTSSIPGKNAVATRGTSFGKDAARQLKK